MSHRRNILIIIALTFSVFCVALGNDFVGDDEVLIVRNLFYKDLSNLKRLADKSYITQSEEYFGARNVHDSFGVVSYRPMVSLSYFLDYQLFRLNPMGYHLHSVVLHVMNALLVYYLIFLVLNRQTVSLIGALVFGVHPLKSEAVCAIAYRHDLLACLFLLLSVIFYLAQDKAGVRRFVYMSASVVFYALSVLSKESAVVLPLLLICYDMILRRPSVRQSLKQLCLRYSGFAVVTGIYLWLYWVVFPNSAVKENLLMGGSYFTHGIIMFQIFMEYVIALIFPMTVKNLPGLYAPEYSLLSIVIATMGALTLACLIALIARNLKKEASVSFFLAWFLVSLIPVSNIIALANPMAYRFVYIPSIGLITAGVILFEKIRWPASNKKAVFWIFLGVSLITTLSVNMTWRNNFTVAHAWTVDYPKDSKGYVVLGIEYYKMKQWDKAIDALKSAKAKGSLDVRIDALIAESENK